jgi:PKD repeat protein
MDVDDRMVATFTWTASGDRNFLSVRARPGHGSEPDDVIVRTVNVTANTPPEIKVDVYPLEVVIGDPINFINNGTSDENGDTLSFLWDFGDGTTSTDATTQHLFPATGPYTVKLTVTDTRGGITTDQWFVTIKKEPPKEEPLLSTTVLGILVLLVVVVLVVVFLVMGRRGRPGDEVSEEATALPPPPTEETPRSRPLPPPPPPPQEEQIPGSPLEEMDNPYYQYDYGPGVDDEAVPDEAVPDEAVPEEGAHEGHHEGRPEGDTEEYDPSPRSDE